MWVHSNDKLLSKTFLLCCVYWSYFSCILLPCRRHSQSNEDKKSRSRSKSPNKSQSRSRSQSKERTTKERYVCDHFSQSYKPILSCVFTPPSGRGPVISIFTPPSGRGLVIPIFFPWFFFFFLVVTCPRPPVFARPNKYSSCLSLHRQGLLS